MKARHRGALRRAATVIAASVAVGISFIVLAPTTAHAVPDGRYVNWATGLCLDGNGTSLYTLTCNGGSYQHWVALPDIYGYKIYHRSWKCLDSNYAGQAYLSACNNGYFQQWYINTDVWPYQVVNAQTGRCLDSNWNGAVYTNPCQSGNNYQRWSS